MTSSPPPGIKATADLMRRLHTAIGRGSRYCLFATKSLSGEAVYRVRLLTPFEKLELPILDAPLRVSFRRAWTVAKDGVPYTGVTLGRSEQLRNEKRECGLLLLRVHTDAVDLHLKPIPSLPHDGGQPWLLTLDFQDLPATASILPSDTQF